MRSMCASASPPTWGRCYTRAGQTQGRSVATHGSQGPSAHTTSVSESVSVTMRTLLSAAPCAAEASAPARSNTTSSTGARRALLRVGWQRSVNP